MPTESRVALYDEVFGFYIDRDYFWANPGHSMLIPYETLETGDEYADAMLDRGFTHVYINMVNMPGIERGRFLLSPSGTDPDDGIEWEAHRKDLNFKWKILVYEAKEQGRLQPVYLSQGAALFSIAD